MAQIGLIHLIFCLAVVCQTIEAGPLLNIDSASHSKPQERVAEAPLALAADSNSNKQQSDLNSSAQASPQLMSTTTTTAHSKPNKPVRSNTTEKLKRGLKAFMNNLNPAPYFVPTPPPGRGPLVAGGKTVGSSKQSDNGAKLEPSADKSSAAAVIKGPNRLVQTRTLGGPLRWGRR